MSLRVIKDQKNQKSEEMMSLEATGSIRISSLAIVSSFNGKKDPMGAIDWILELELAFFTCA